MNQNMNASSLALCDAQYGAAYLALSFANFGPYMLVESQIFCSSNTLRYRLFVTTRAFSLSLYLGM